MAHPGFFPKKVGDGIQRRLDEKAEAAEEVIEQLRDGGYPLRFHVTRYFLCPVCDREWWDRVRVPEDVMGTIARHVGHPEPGSRVEQACPAAECQAFNHLDQMSKMSK